MSYLKRHGTRRVPQKAPIPGSGQVRNSAGGFAWAVDDWTRLRRFLILGTEGGSYYATEWTLTRENAQALERCLAEDGPRAVQEIVRVSDEGRAPKNDPAIFALAMAAGLGDPGRDGDARPRVPPAARGAAERAPHRGRGLGGAPRGHADDGGDPQPGDDDAGRRPRAGLGRDGEGRRAARRRRAHPSRTGASDRPARGAAHLRGRSRCPRPER